MKRSAVRAQTQFMPSGQVARRLNISPRTLGKLTGNVYAVVRALAPNALCVALMAWASSKLASSQLAITQDKRNCVRDTVLFIHKLSTGFHGPWRTDMYANTCSVNQGQAVVLKVKDMRAITCTARHGQIRRSVFGM